MSVQLFTIHLDGQRHYLGLFPTQEGAEAFAMAGWRQEWQRVWTEDLNGPTAVLRPPLAFAESLRPSFRPLQVLSLPGDWWGLAQDGRTLAIYDDRELLGALRSQPRWLQAAREWEQARANLPSSLSTLKVEL